MRAAGESKRRFAGYGVAAAALAACTTTPPAPLPDPSSDAPSPNASILPAPLAPVRPHDAGTDGGPDAGDAAARALNSATPDAAAPPPRTLREDAPVDVDPWPGKELRPGLTLAARFTWPGFAPSAAAEADLRVAERLAEQTARIVRITLTPAGRMRLVLDSPSFAVERGVELRSRIDRYGHVVVWPDQHSYRVLQPGTLRAFFNEGRADVLPLDSVTASQLPPGSALGWDTVSVVLGTDIGKLTLTQARIPGSGDAGALVCRLLLELACGEPASPSCAADLVPLRAAYEWTDGGKLLFEVTAATRAAEVDVTTLRVPPIAPSFKADLLPAAGSGPLVGSGDLRALRRRDAPAPPDDAGAPPAEGFELTNRTDTLAFALLDGIAVARVEPAHSVTLPTLRPGRYSLRWTDFLGGEVTAPEIVSVPGTSTRGTAPDAGLTPSP